MGRLIIVLFVLVLSVLWTACKQAPQSPSPPVLSLPRPNVHLIATPASGKDCNTNRMHIRFDWDVGNTQDAGAQDIYNLYMDSPLGVLFASGRRQGHGEIINSAHAAQWFFLVNARTREVVAAVRIGPDTCD